MKKKGSNKRKVKPVNPPEKTKPKKIFFFWKNKTAPVVFIAAVFVFAFFMLFFNSPTGRAINGTSITGNDINSPVPTWVSGFSNALGLGDTWKQIIIGIIVMLIIFAGLYDIIELTSIINNSWVIAIIAAGLAIIFALVDVVRNIAAWLFTLVATLGTLGIVLEIGICIVIFIGLSFGGSKIADWSAKRQANRTRAQAVRNSGKLAGGIAAIKAVERETNRPYRGLG